MGNPNQRIIVVNKKVLFKGDYFQGFKPAEGVDYESRILGNIEVMRRGSTDEPAEHPQGNAEMNTFYKQPTGYTIVANLSKGIVFAYQRSTDKKNYSEKRLQGNWSWGFGGHIEPFDSKNGNPIRESILREVTREELQIMGNVKEPKLLGYINDDAQSEEDTKLGRVSIGRVHFGMLYVIDTDATEVQPNKEATIAVAKTFSELEELCTSSNVKVEEWSRISLEALRKILK